MSNTCDPLLGYPQVAIRLRVWERASIQERLNSLPPLRLRAQKAASYNLRMVSCDYLARRKATLRRSDLSKWARMIKPATKVPFGFSASWFTPSDGPPRRPLTAEEARKGAVQEWSKLMVEPSCKWHHPLIKQYKSEWGRPCGTINLEVACNAPPGDNTRDIAQAYMGSPESGYSIVYWSSPCEVRWLSEYSLQIEDNHYERGWPVEVNLSRSLTWSVRGGDRYLW